MVEWVGLEDGECNQGNGRDNDLDTDSTNTALR